MGPRTVTIRRVFCVLLAFTGVVAVQRGLERPADPAAAASPALTTPVSSPRRVPGPVIDAAGAIVLQGELDSRVDASAGCVTVATSSGRALAAVAPDTARTPASTMKLATAIAALDQLGADHRFRTAVVGSTAPRGGAVERVYLVGGGDPLLAGPERIAFLDRDPEETGLARTPLADLTDRIVDAGVERIPGGIVGVDDRYTGPRALPSWSPGARAAIGPIGALVVNDGQGGSAGTAGAVDDPAQHAAAELARLLTARGVQVGPASSAERAPDGPEIAAIESPPLSEVLTEMLSASDNLTAEMLVREVGHTDGEGSTEHGVEVVRRTLGALGVRLDGARFADGSGLSRDDALSCRTLEDLLVLTARDRFRPVADGLAVAGSRGTLATRLRGTPLEGNLTAKTGTLDGVSGLAGFVNADRRLRFALLVGGAFGEAGANQIREDIASVVAGFPRIGDPETLVPAPASAGTADNSR